MPVSQIYLGIPPAVFYRMTVRGANNKIALKLQLEAEVHSP